MPIKLKHIMDNMPINAPAKTFGLLNFIPKKNIPINKYKSILIEANTKSHILMPIIISTIELGVTSMDSKTPEVCASLIWPAKVDKDAVK